MADVVEVFLDNETSIIVDVAPSELAVANYKETDLVEATAVIGPQGIQGIQGEKGDEAAAYVSEFPPPPPNNAGDFWIQPTAIYADYPADVFVSPVKPTFTNPGLWIQTGLGPDGSGFTFWIEDGV